MNIELSTSSKTLFGFVLGTASLLYFFLSQRRQRLRKLSSMPVIGPLATLFSNDEVSRLQDLKEKHGDLYMIDYGLVNCVSISDSQVIHKILNDEETFPKMSLPLPKVMSDLQKNTLVDTNGVEWERHRTITKNSFDSEAIKSYVPLLVETTEKLVKILDMQDIDREINMVPWVNKAVMDGLGQVIFGFNFDSLNNRNMNYVNAYTNYLVLSSNPIWTVLPWLEKLPLPSSRNLKKSTEKLNDLLNKIMKDKLDRKRSGYKIECPSVFDHAVDSVYGSTDDGVLTEKELKADVFTFFLCGHETTAASISWGLFLLAQNPDVQEKVYEEIKVVLKGKEPTFEDFKNMSYLQRTTKEILRLKPPVYQLSTRFAMKDVPIEGTNYVIPENSIINLLIDQVQHHPDHWEKPDKFDPDRFLHSITLPDEHNSHDPKGIHPFTFLPFSLGKRKCLGAPLSILHMQVTLCMLLQKYEFKMGRSNTRKRKGSINTPESTYLFLEERTKQSPSLTSDLSKV